MDSAQSSSAKKMLFPKSKPSPSKLSGAPSGDPWSTKTPEKPIDPPRRTRSATAAFSLKQVRQAALKLRKSHQNNPPPQPDPLLSSSMPQMGSSKANSKKPAGPVKLPEKYELLEKFFCSLDSSLRLLQLKGSSTTFTNIRPKVECLTDRRFSYAHLAQLKFILPEAIEIKQLLVCDERTSCMKPELHITLNASAVENDTKLRSNSSSVQLRKVFRTRLLNFVKSHPEGDDIPEEALPGQFGKSKHEVLTNLPESGCSQPLSERVIGSVPEQPLAAASHLSRSFRKSFLNRVSFGEAVVTKQQSLVTEIAENINENISSIASDKCHSKKSPLPSTPMKDIISDKGSAILTSGETPVKLTESTPDKLMTSTPMLQPPKRCYMSPSDSTDSPIKLARRPSRNRSLIFNTPAKSLSFSDKACKNELSTNDDSIDFLPEELLQSIREKERKALEDQDPAISQAKWRKRMISSLPKFFDTIFFLFQSIKRSVITKEELVHKVVSSLLEITDKREVEEQLRLLQELAPEWISEKTASSGDLLLCVNKISSPEAIRTRLADAN